MDIEILLKKEVLNALSVLYSLEVMDSQVQLQETRKEFEGDITLVVFPLLKISKKSPEQTSEDIGNYLLEHSELIIRFNVVKGFLNLVIHSSYWIGVLADAA
ncbi:MAG: arginine--tRNA ligase, partial [Prolixibacteraceae bacterium]|nr:arginine--tRNA ligase [Prolixibacteraceae bacterium]